MKDMQMNKFKQVEELAKELDTSYDLAWDLVYGNNGYDMTNPDETDDAL